MCSNRPTPNSGDTNNFMMWKGSSYNNNNANNNNAVAP